MPEIILELSLNRSSGVLAGIVASLAQAGVELKSQKLQRATEGRGGWLTITGSGDSPEPAVLAERLNGTRGVEKLMRVIVDGEAILAEGKPLEDQIQPDDLAELSAGSGIEPDENLEAPEPPPTVDPPREVQTNAPDIDDLPILSEPEAADDPPTEPDPGRKIREVVADPAEQDLAAALNAPDEMTEEDEPTPEFAPEPDAESDLADALRDEAEPAEAREPSTGGQEDSDPVQVGAVLRRRRRRRR